MFGRQRLDLNKGGEQGTFIVPKITATAQINVSIW
jgi:hypothetical protein